MNIANIAKSQSTTKDPYEERTLLAMWVARADIGVKCTCAAFSPNADFLAVGDDMGATSIFDPKNGRMRSRLGAVHTKRTTDLKSQLADNDRGIAMAVRFNPTSGGRPKIRVALSTGKIECFDVKNGSSNATNTVENGQILALDYSKDGKWYAAGGMDKQSPEHRGHNVRVYDDSTSKLVKELAGDHLNEGHSNRITCIRFKGSAELATGSMDGTVKLWDHRGCDVGPAMSFPDSGKTESLFEVSGPSIDFSPDGNYMLIGSARPHKHLLLYDIRKPGIPLVSEVLWRKLKPAKSKAANKWNLAKLAHMQKSNILAASFIDGGKIIAGGSGTNMVKIFTPNSQLKTPDAPYPVGEAAAAEGLAEPMRDLFSATASFDVPSGVCGVDVSAKPVLKKGEEIMGENGEKETVKADIKLIAIAASDGNVYGVQLPNNLPTHTEVVL